MSDFQEREAVKRLYGIAKAQVNRTYKGFLPFVSSTIHRALIAEMILGIIAAQDSTAEAETIRKLVTGLWDALNTDPEVV